MNKESADPNLLDELDAASSTADSDDKAPETPGPGIRARLEALEKQVARITLLQEAMAKQALGRNYPPPDDASSAGSSGLTGAIFNYLSPK